MYLYQIHALVYIFYSVHTDVVRIIFNEHISGLLDGNILQYSKLNERWVMMTQTNDMIELQIQYAN